MAKLIAGIVIRFFTLTATVSKNRPLDVSKYRNELLTLLNNPKTRKRLRRLLTFEVVQLRCPRNSVSFAFSSLLLNPVVIN